MKTLLVAAGLAMTIIPHQATAQSTVLAAENSLARTCYMSALTMRHDQVAIRECGQALDIEAMVRDDRVATYINRGILHMLANNAAAANRDFDTALAMDPAQPEAWLNKSVTLQNAGNSSDAVNLATRAIELRTQKPALAYYVRGLAHERSGAVRLAYADLQRARDLAPQWGEPAEQLKRYRTVRR